MSETERRQHPRIQLPLLVELQHPSLGRKRCVARDVSEGGVFVYLEESGLRPGATLRLTLKNATTLDTQPTPTVEMEVRRVDKDGLGLEFRNRTSRHLWESVERIRAELAIGRDYFQLHVAALVLKDPGRLLIVQQNGRWTFPGLYLVVGDDWREALRAMLKERFGITADPATMQLLSLETESSDKIPEAAVAKTFVIMQADATEYHFEPGDRYKDDRWLQNPRMIDELTFADDLTRRQALTAFRWLDEQDA
ncbi:MAG: PilZ domain-containing protein [Pseudomonadota bacterium]